MDVILLQFRQRCNRGRFNNLDLLFCQAVEVIDEAVDFLICDVDLTLKAFLISRRLGGSQLLVKIQHAFDE
jgi:hypothetical protein